MLRAVEGSMKTTPSFAANRHTKKRGSKAKKDIDLAGNVHTAEMKVFLYPVDNRFQLTADFGSNLL